MLTSVVVLAETSLTALLLPEIRLTTVLLMGERGRVSYSIENVLCNNNR